MISTPMHTRPKGQQDVLLLTAPPIPVVKIGLVGLGARATRAIHRFMHMEDVCITALCDIVDTNIKKAQEVLSTNSKPKATEYSGTDGWKRLCEDSNIDLVYICTDWESHTRIAVYGMECDKHIAVEVPAATAVEECWQLVDTSERTRKHCMMLENACYDFFELTVLNMAQQGLFGEIIHGEGAYIHDIRNLILADEKDSCTNNWQIKYNLRHTGNPYPTHGLGPICQVMNMHRGDRMKRLVSMSTKQMGLTDYAVRKYGKDAEPARNPYLLGDMNTTLIYTEAGHTIMLQHNKSNPRPYSRIHLLNGTKGYTQKYPVEQMAFDAEHPLSTTEIQELLQEYEHPFITQLGKKAVEVADIRARDYIMDSRLIHCLKNGLPLDQDVYDAAEWSCIVELSETSVLNENEPVEIPDFTRGNWNKLKRLRFA